MRSEEPYNYKFRLADLGRIFTEKSHFLINSISDLMSVKYY